MNEILKAVLAANRQYAATFGDRVNLPKPPARQLAILTCMDARLDPYQFAGLKEGDAHIVRNAGGRATDDAIRSLVISYKLLGTRVWVVIHHTDCGMESFTDDVMRRLLASSLKPARADSTGWHDPGGNDGSRAGDYINWLAISDRQQSVVDDVRRIRTHPLVPRDLPIYGYLFDVQTGRLVEVAEATQVGQAR